MWQSKKKTPAFPFFGAFGFLGLALGPICGSYLAISNLGWRWTNYFVSILGFVLSLLTIFFKPETYKPIIRVLKANRIRKITEHQRYMSVHDMEKEGQSLGTFSVILRPFIYFCTEPLVTWFTICFSVSYIVLSSDFESFLMIFEIWDWSNTKSWFLFISVASVIIFTLVVITPIAYVFFMREVRIKGSFDKVAPKIRLVPLMFCSWCIAISLFFDGMDFIQNNFSVVMHIFYFPFWYRNNASISYYLFLHN